MKYLKVWGYETLKTWAALAFLGLLGSLSGGIDDAGEYLMGMLLYTGATALICNLALALFDRELRWAIEDFFTKR